MLRGWADVGTGPGKESPWRGCCGTTLWCERGRRGKGREAQGLSSAVGSHGAILTCISPTPCEGREGEGEEEEEEGYCPLFPRSLLWGFPWMLLLLLLETRAEKEVAPTDQRFSTTRGGGWCGRANAKLWGTGAAGGVGGGGALMAPLGLCCDADADAAAACWCWWDCG